MSMSQHDDSTIPQQPIAAVVIIGPAPEMLDVWLEVLQRLDEVPSIQVTDLKGAATAVARWRPVALLVERELFEFDSKEFTALARDVGAEVIAVHASADKEGVASIVLPKLEAALERWRERTDLET